MQPLLGRKASLFTGTAIPLPIKLYMALRVGYAEILSQCPTPGTVEYSTNRFLWKLKFRRVFWTAQTSVSVFVQRASLQVKKWQSNERKKISKANLRQFTVGRTAPIVGPMKDSVHHEVSIFFWPVPNLFLISTV